MARYLFIVGQDQPDLRDYFTRWFSEVPEVDVVSDRRRGERRQGGQSREPERRRADRRRSLNLNEEIRQTGFAIVGPPLI
ncbi:MAG: hypothetical protein ACREH7_00255 [Candidatus Rokuibacteriota bacterium]